MPLRYTESVYVNVPGPSRRRIDTLEPVQKSGTNGSQTSKALSTIKGRNDQITLLIVLIPSTNHETDEESGRGGGGIGEGGE